MKAQSPVVFSIENKNSAVGENVCLELSVVDFTEVTSLQLPVKWNNASLANATLNNEALSGSFFNINESLGELRYLWDDPSLTNPVSLDSASVLFSLCFDVVGGKGMDEPVEMITLENPEFEVLVLNSDLDEMEFITNNGLVMIADDCNGVAVLPESICQNVEFTVTVDLEATGLAISNFGYWEIDGEPVLESFEGETFPDDMGSVEITFVNSLFDDNYKEELILSITDTEPHTFQYFYDFINCIDSTEVFVLQALAQPEDLDLDIPANVCFDEGFILDLDIEQEGDFEFRFSINGVDSIKVVSSSDDSLVFENLTSNIQLAFSILTNNETSCFSTNITPKDSLVNVYNEFVINLVDSICNDDGSFMAIYDLEGGSGDYELLTNSDGQLLDGQYSTNLLTPEEPDTVTISDEFCQATSITFSPEVLCSCTDTVTVFELKILISCETGEIIPEVERELVTALENPVTFYRIYSKDDNDEIDEVLFDTLLYSEDNPVIPFDSKYENGRTYFAVPILSQRLDGEIDLEYRCISVGQEIRFRYYRNPTPEILGEQIVCTNQLETKYEASTNNPVNEFTWQVDNNAEGFQLANNFYVTFNSSSPVSIGLNEIYRPIDLAGDLECEGNDEYTVTVNEEVASEKIDIILFPDGFLSAVGDDSYCYQWATIEKATGIFMENGPSGKVWIVGEEIDTNKFIYLCIVSNPIDGSCENSACPTYNYFNSTGPVALKNEAFQDLQVFPNPTTGFVKLSSAGFTGVENVKLYDATGNQLFVNVQWNNGHYLVNTDTLGQGVYYFAIDNKLSSVPVIKKLVKL